MSQQQFGGSHSARKLDALERYIDAYLTALKFQGFELVFFDAFAGTGEIPLPREHDQQPLWDDADDRLFIVGSSQRVLQRADRFDKLVFVEQDAKKRAALHQLASRFPGAAAKIQIRDGDANEQLRNFCAREMTSRTRAIVFLDPFGNQVAWDTIKAIANTRAIDLWYLFPAGLGVQRQISTDGTVDPTHEASLDRLFGTPDWRTAFIRTTIETDVFGDLFQSTSRSADAEKITRFMVERMQGVFKGGVLDSWMRLGPGRAHWYSLLFAWANPSARAGDLARKFALSALRA